jgi:hypothetical protein
LFFFSKTEEPTLKQYIGELLHLRFRIRQAHGLPKKLATNCFVTFKFFMEGEPLKTGTCGAKVTIDERKLLLVLAE